MKIVAHREGLLESCKQVAKAVATRDVKPIYRNLAFHAADQTLHLYATNLEIAARLRCSGVVVESMGHALIEPKFLLPILEHAVGEEVTIAVDRSKGVITLGDDQRWELPVDDPSDYPDPKPFIEDAYHEIPAGVLWSLIQGTLYCAATEGQVRFGATTGVLWDLEGSTASLIATDGRRLAKGTGTAVSVGGHATGNKFTGTVKPGESSVHCVVPSEFMQMLADKLETLPPKVPVKVAFRWKKGEVFVSAGDLDLYTRLVEGRFPNYAQVIPAKFNHTIALQPGAFLSAVRRAFPMTEDERTFRIDCTFSPGCLEITAEDCEKATASIKLPVAYDGVPFTVLFDARKVADLMEELDPMLPVEMSVRSVSEPVKFTQGPFLYLLVPLVKS